MGSVLAMGALTLFWALGMHLDLVQVLLHTTQTLPLGQSFELGTSLFMQYFSAAFMLGLTLVFPVMASLFIVDVAAGIVSKSMPQMNVYFVIMPLKILVGLIITAITLKQLAHHFEKIVSLPIQFLGGL